MTASLREAAQQAMNALGNSKRYIRAAADGETLLGWGMQLDLSDIASSALRAALALPDAEPVAVIPAGYALVPLEMTEEMIQAGCLSQQATPEYGNYEDWCNSHSGGIIERIRGYLRKDYRAIIAAAPQPAPSPARNFCPDCGKRNGPAPAVHTCTPGGPEAVERARHQNIGLCCEMPLTEVQKAAQ